METSVRTPMSREMANANTPFIHNAWYVVALSSEISRMPIARTVLGQSLVLFRTEAGAPVALQNRCCHRGFPLVHGRLEGDTIVCGYHGLRYDVSGRCVEIPMQSSVPSVVKVRGYPTVELGDFVWVWTGEANKAHDSSPPHPEWMNHQEWDARSGYLHVKGNYVHLHENLLDLSHLSFLHATTFGTPEYARAPVQNKINGTDIQVWRQVECHLPPIYAEPLGWKGERALRMSGSQYVAPGLHVNTGTFRNLDRPDASERFHPTVKVAQIITPETQHSTHYWTVQARNFARGRPEMSDFMITQQLAAFQEDLFAIERITELMQLESDQQAQQINLPTDRAGATMRRHLQYLADLEQA